MIYRIEINIKMNNKEIARHFSELASLMELQKENPFKIKSYSNAYLTIRKLDIDLNEKSASDLENIPGIGKAIAAKIVELISTGEMATLQKYREMTPEGIQELLKVNGLGPKKVEAIWKNLGIESPGELLYACNENRLVELSGFGTKTQELVKAKLEFYFNASGKYLYQRATEFVEPLLVELNKRYPNISIQMVGELKRKCPVIEKIELICIQNDEMDEILSHFTLQYDIKNAEVACQLKNEMNAIIHIVAKEDFGVKLFELTGPSDFVDAFLLKYNLPVSSKDENEIFDFNKLPYYPAVLRDNDLCNEEYFKSGNIPALIQYEDIKGIVHNHSTWSDGVHSIKDMALYVKETGFQYFVISDHSKSAFYANGLSIDRVYQQWGEIDKINTEFQDFKIFKSIESDILSDGQLDYPDDILQGFDLVIASIHSNLNMSEEKAMHRLIQAIENPYTRILGHPTGRLLLARSGYPVDHVKLIDACAANNVVIELNANPLRLDIDWTCIPYAIQKGVRIAINPDAHNKTGIFDVRYGVYAAQKAGLEAKDCINTLSLADFKLWLGDK